MNLDQCLFIHAGMDASFTVYSDGVVATRFVDAFTMQLIGQAELYRLEPAKSAQWIVVAETKQGKVSTRTWQRSGDDFVEVLEREHRLRIWNEAGRKLKGLAA